MKSGCRVEESRLSTAQRLINLIALLCILSWRIVWLTMINRAAPEALATVVFTLIEKCCLLNLSYRNQGAPLSDNRRCLAVSFIEFGFLLGAQTCG